MIGPRSFWRVEVARRANLGSHLETFLVAAVVSVLAIRVFLGLTGFPQLGGGGLHIAHVLWGGLLMLVALVIVLSLLGNSARRVAAAIGGIGFGAFIDELGKFLTSDNDYFFQPAIALIYVVFVLLFLAFRALQNRSRLTPREAVINSAANLVDVLLDGATPEEINRTLELLRVGGDRGVVAQSIRRAILAAPRVEERTSLPARVATWLRAAYSRFAAWAWFQRSLVIVFLGHAATALSLSVWTVYQPGPGGPAGVATRSFADVGGLLAALTSLVLAVVGTTRLPFSRLRAYVWFKRSVLVSIFLVQFFSFYLNQLGALAGLAVDLVLLGGLNYALRSEYWRGDEANEGKEEPEGDAGN